MIHLICPNPAIDRTLLLQNFAKSTPNRPYEVREFAGGKSFNVAYAMTFEEPTIELVVHTIIGGKNGEYLKELAEKSKIQLSAIEIEENTRVCNILVDSEKHEVYPIYENSFKLQSNLLDHFTKSLEDSIQDGDTVVFSGSLMQGMPHDYILQFQTKFKNQKVKFFVDTSGEALKQAYEGKPYAIKINDEEILDLFPKAKFSSIDDYAKFLQSQVITEIPYFIVTLGAKGVIAKLKEKIYYLSLEKIEAKNPIASGDFFLGGFVKYLTLSGDPIFSLKKAISYSTANVLNWYPELSIEQVKSFFETVKIETLY
ncbi:tagatose 6-phosphate kinase [Pilibacter termitis]|uniref:Tagatose-6-phosphate kinase n=1 Tax=Pilibacter termitis TaxID=263852 RepID=A0A1T4K764_9ENTE|nr:PfkB family carbohydrate kinase [Pilibacter termitis]SJZ38252.1 tagatose 6-phosphate kinase [Pilibacter termitis]